MLHILVHSAAAWRTNFFNQALRLRRPHHLLSEPGYVLNCMSGWQVKTRTILGKLGMHCHPNHDPHCPEHLPHKPNLILYPSHPHPYPNFSLCLPRQQSGDPHTFILFEECFFHLPNSPETWFSLWLLFLQIAQAVAIFKDTFFSFIHLVPDSKYSFLLLIAISKPCLHISWRWGWGVLGFHPYLWGWGYLTWTLPPLYHLVTSVTPHHALGVNSWLSTFAFSSIPVTITGNFNHQHDCSIFHDIM